MFLFSRQEFIDFQGDKKTFRLSNFYKTGRKKFEILLDENSEPIGNKWSFDEENRKKIPNDVSVPQPCMQKLSKYHGPVIDIIENHFADHPGSLENIWFPVQRRGVEEQLQNFLSHKLANFEFMRTQCAQMKIFYFTAALVRFLIWV